MEAARLEVVPIRFLRQLGYENADKTAAATLPLSANLVGTSDETATVRYRDTALNSSAIVGGAIGFPSRGSCQR